MASCSSSVSEPSFPNAERSGPDHGRGGLFRPFDLFLVGSWFGLVTGLIELAGSLFAIKILGRITYDTLRTNWHYVWLTPLSNVLLFALPALVVAIASILFPQLRRGKTAVFLFGFMAAWSLFLAVPGAHLLARIVLALGAASVITRVVLSRGEGFLWLVRRTSAVGFAMIPSLMILCLATTAWTRILAPAAPAGAEVAPNVLMIVLDTVRADSLTPYGAERDTTPNLARLAEKGVLFEHARSTAPWTLPSHASLFTGRWPFELSADVGRPLDGTFPTVAERLSEHGYATGGFVANTENCNAWYGLARGFQHYEDYYENSVVTPLEVLRTSRLGRFVATSRVGWSIIKSVMKPESYRYRKSAAMINRDALAWLSDQGERPFFMFLNYFDVHDPYVTPADAERRFSKKGAEAGSTVDPARDAYDDCLSYLDDQIGHLLTELERRGKLQDTLIIVTADHGEGFGEHGLAGHGVSLYRAETHIPLMVVQPSRVPAGRTVAHPVSLRDVALTVLDLVGVDEAETFPGRSLAATWEADSRNLAPIEPVLVEVDRAAYVPQEVEDAPARLGRMRSVVALGHTYILNGDGREELYDLDSDPEETTDLIDSPDAQDDLKHLREQLDRVTRLE